MTFYIDVSSHLYIEKFIYSIEILIYLLISTRDKKKFTYIPSHFNFLWQEIKENPFCAIFYGNTKRRVALFKAIQGPKSGYCTQDMPRLVCKLI